MNGIQSLASTALNLFREFVPGNPDAALFWLETGSAALSLLLVLGMLLRFFGSENVKPGLLLLGTVLGLLLLAVGPAAVELYLLPSLPPGAQSAVETVAHWLGERTHLTPAPTRMILLISGAILSFLFLVIPLTRLTFRIPGFLALIAWLAALVTSITVPNVIRTALQAPAAKTSLPITPHLPEKKN